MLEGPSIRPPYALSNPHPHVSTRGPLASQRRGGMADNGRATTPSAAMHATSTLLSPVVGLDFTGEQVYLDDLLSSRILAQEFISADRLMKRFCQLSAQLLDMMGVTN
ncbi:hypothetical protein PAHAL_4G192100 [Panicum hallii]|uniref:Uncharacterized protein n=1 Tax=Panicum hallii TaxID=206008 RepID=A0A2T8JDG1_9POAL|nr:hypothetical protein PAHAL_4G192100 [Panicum hallii]